MKRKERPSAAQQKRAEKDELVERLVKSHGMVQLVDSEGNTTGPPLDISLGTRLGQLNDVVNELLSNEDQLMRCLEPLLRRHPAVVSCHDPATGQSLLHYVVETCSRTPSIIELLLALPGRWCAGWCGKWLAFR